MMKRKIQLKLGYLFIILYLFSMVGFSGFYTEKASAATECGTQSSLKSYAYLISLYDQSEKWLGYSVPIDSDFRMVAVLRIPVKCLSETASDGSNTTSLYRNFSLEFALETFNGGIKQIAKNPPVRLNKLINGDTVEYTIDLHWAVSGLEAKNVAGKVKVGDEFVPFAVLKDNVSLEYYKTYFSTKPIKVVEGTNVSPKDNDSGGGGGTTTPIAGRIDSPIGIKSIGDFLVTIIRYLLGFLAGLSVLFIIIGGVRLVVSGGRDGEIKAGKQTITWAVIGLVVSLLAFTIVNVVQSLLKVGVK